MENEKILNGTKFETTKLDKNNLDTISGGFKIHRLGYLNDKKTAVITWADGFTDCLEFESAEARESGMEYLRSLGSDEVSLDQITRQLRENGLDNHFWEFQGTMARRSHATMKDTR